jgi:hypothetical protein
LSCTAASFSFGDVALAHALFDVDHRTPTPCPASSINILIFSIQQQSPADAFISLGSSMPIIGSMNVVGRRMPSLLIPARSFVHQACFSQQTQVKHKIPAHVAEDFYRYTSGRWLWKDSLRLQERYKRFNVAELQRVATEASGAQSCLQMTKLAEGGFNKVFKLVMDNGRIVIARIPNHNVGRIDRVTASEVATMEFVRVQKPDSFIMLLTQERREQSLVSRYRECCHGAETVRVPSSLLTFSWSTPKVHSLAKFGKIWRSTRSRLSLTR